MRQYTKTGFRVSEYELAHILKSYLHKRGDIDEDEEIEYFPYKDGIMILVYKDSRLAEVPSRVRIVEYDDSLELAAKMGGH